MHSVRLILSLRTAPLDFDVSSVGCQRSGLRIELILHLVGPGLHSPIINPSAVISLLRLSMLPELWVSRQQRFNTGQPILQINESHALKNNIPGDYLECLESQFLCQSFEPPHIGLPWFDFDLVGFFSIEDDVDFNSTISLIVIDLSSQPWRLENTIFKGLSSLTGAR